MHINNKMEDFVITLLKENIGTDHYYHNFEHALYVQEKAMEIGMHEQCTEKEMELLSAAALWHDTGHIIRYAGHEEQSCLLVKKYLPAYGFSEKDIDSICGMIMATKVPQSPTNKLEEIIADADLEYFGNGNAKEKADLLFQELKSLTPMLTTAAWDKMQIEFLQNHHYFTQYCKKEKEPVKQAYLKELLNTDK